MQQEPLEKRYCKCGCGEKFQPHNAKHLYKSEAHKSRSQRARKKARSLDAEKATWYKNLEDTAFGWYRRLCGENDQTPDLFWDLYQLGGIALADRVLTYAAFLSDDAFNHGKAEGARGEVPFDPPYTVEFAHDNVFTAFPLNDEEG